MAAADTAFTVKVDGRTFTLDRITLGDWRMLKTEFGLTAADIITEAPNGKGETVQILNLQDPNVLIGLMVAAVRHERPTEPISALIAEVEDLGMDGLEFPDLKTDESDPTKAGDGSEETEGRSKSGNRAKPRKQPGIPR